MDFVLHAQMSPETDCVEKLTSRFKNTILNLKCLFKRSIQTICIETLFSSGSKSITFKLHVISRVRVVEKNVQNFIFCVESLHRGGTVEKYISLCEVTPGSIPGGQLARIFLEKKIVSCAVKSLMEARC